MAESLTIVCDRCGEKTTPARRTRVRFSREPVKRLPVDLCDDCRSELEAWLQAPRIPSLARAIAGEN